MRIYAKIFCKGYDYRSNYLKKNTKGIIPQVAQHQRHLIRIFPGNPTVAQHAMVPWRHTGQEAGTGRRTAGGRSITTGEEGSLLGQLVDVGRDDRLIPHAM